MDLDEMFDFSEMATWISLGLAIIGAMGAFYYANYLGTGASFVTKSISALGTLVIGYFVSFWILTR